MKSALLILLCVTAAYAATSCVGRCGNEDVDPDSCQCNTVCPDFNDCCSDYESICFFCKDRCGEAYDETSPCQCNSICGDWGDCCDDYNTECNNGTGSAVTDQDVIDLTEELFRVDTNRKTLVYESAPPGPLFTAKNPSVDLVGPTITPFLALRDLYAPDACTLEGDYSAEMTTFLDAAFATDVMNTTEQFFINFDLLSGTSYFTLREAIEDIWFVLFSSCNSGTVAGSCGFEHGFVGEIDGDVSGYHNWISWYLDEQEGTLDYTSCLGEQVIASDLSVLMVSFDWLSQSKPISSLYIGSSPEYELAAYTVCYFYKPNSLCNVSSNGVAYQIQTYDSSGLVETSYPVIDQGTCTTHF